MTRDELLAGLTTWTEPKRWTRQTIAHRDRLQFAIWWYCRSTEADKPDPQWPDDDYVAAKTGGGPRYLESIDDALLLVPGGMYWLIGAGKTRPNETLFGVQIVDPITSAVIVEAEHDATAALAVCIAALKARIARGSIAKGEGAFSRDPLEHASNTIDSMKEIALTALTEHGAT